jgi:ribosome-binding factor A
VSGRRPERVGEAIRQTIAELLLREVKDPRVRMVTLTSVEVSVDLRYARVYFTCGTDADARERALRGLRSAGGFLRAQLTRRLRLRYAPELSFFVDSGIDAAEHMARLLRDVDAGES